jgi:hypothetical protein
MTPARWPADPTMLLSAAVGARVALEKLVPACLPVVAGGRGHPVGHLATPDGETLCGYRARVTGLRPVEPLPARQLRLCRRCARRLRDRGADLTPTRWERAAWCQAELLAAVAAHDTERREAAITAAIAAGVMAVRGPWIPDSAHEVPLHSLIALWRGGQASRDAALDQVAERARLAMAGARR